jgi:transposase InsO family protein
VRFTDEKKYFVSEASVYRLLKAHDLITSPVYVVIKAANEFKDKTTAINQLCQTDFTYLKIIGWGLYYLSTVLDDFSRYIVTWRLGPTMCASDVTATLDQALAVSGLDDITVTQRLRPSTAKVTATLLSAKYGQRFNGITMNDATLQHWIIHLIIKPRRWTDAAIGGERTTEHRIAVS